MKHGRKLSFVSFVVYLLAAMPVTWGVGTIGDSTNEVSAPLKADFLETVTLCHWQGTNYFNARTLHVPEAAVGTHIAHGDYLRACFTCAAAPSTGATINDARTEPCTPQGAAYDLLPANPATAVEAAPKTTDSSPSGP
jgi:hypothetical protein